MKKTTLLLLFSLVWAAPLRAQDSLAIINIGSDHTQQPAADTLRANPYANYPADTLWNQAAAAYAQSDFVGASDRYLAILGKGDESAKLYYNLGNAYFKQHRMGRAILYYERALILNPAGEDIRYNLSLANARIVDKIDTVPEFFLKTWIRSAGLWVSSNTWAWLGLGMLALALGAILLWLLSNKLFWRKSGFWGGIVCTALFVASTCYSQFQRGRQQGSREAIVMNSAVPVKSAPDASSKDLFALHEGTKVRTGETLGEWVEITVADGNKGWVTATAIENIN